jgi:hypothetical protein
MPLPVGVQSATSHVLLNAPYACSVSRALPLCDCTEDELFPCLHCCDVMSCHFQHAQQPDCFSIIIKFGPVNVLLRYDRIAVWFVCLVPVCVWSTAVVVHGCMLLLDPQQCGLYVQVYSNIYSLSAASNAT